jgi:hypothetical protein
LVILARAVTVAVAVVAVGCRSDETPATTSEPMAETPPARSAPAGNTAPGAPEKKLYGAPISNAAVADLSEVLKDPERFRGQNLVLNGHVRRACTRMGCWMELAAAADPASPACRVFFHGHGFFVPKDSAGSDARVEGKLELVSVSPEHAAHLEEEGGRVPNKASDGSAREVRLVASGVELFRRGG